MKLIVQLILLMHTSDESQMHIQADFLATRNLLLRLVTSRLIVNAADLWLLESTNSTTHTTAAGSANKIRVITVLITTVIRNSNNAVTYRFKLCSEVTEQLCGVDPLQALDGVSLIVEADEASCYIAQVVVGVNPTACTIVHT